MYGSTNQIDGTGRLSKRWSIEVGEVGRHGQEPRRYSFFNGRELFKHELQIVVLLGVRVLRLMVGEESTEMSTRGFVRCSFHGERGGCITDTPEGS